MDFISFDELIIIVVVALLVLGPAKTFKLMFSVGQLFAKAKSYLNSVKTQLQLDEIRHTFSSVKENDFHEVVNRISPIPTKVILKVKSSGLLVLTTLKKHHLISLQLMMKIFLKQLSIKIRLMQI